MDKRHTVDLKRRKLTNEKNRNFSFNFIFRDNVGLYVKPGFGKS